MVRIAVIGTGGMGQKYMDLIRAGRAPSLQLTAAVARKEETRIRFREKYGNELALFESEDELYLHTDLFDAVLIATPHRLHPAMAERALKSGKHVFCDKPVGISVKQCRPLMETAAGTDRVFSVMFHQRGYDKYRRIKELLDQETIGKVYRILMENSRYLRTAHYHSSGAWRSSWQGEGGGALINQGQHILDIWQWLFGMPQELTAQIAFGKYNDFDVDDEAILQMKYGNGTSGTFILTTGEGTWTERLTVSGSRGTLVLDKDLLTLHTYDQDLEEYRRTAACNAGELLKESSEAWALPVKEEPYPVLLENFGQAIEAGEPLLVEGQDAIHAVELMNAAYLSAWTGSTVSLPVNEDRYEELLHLHGG